MTSAAVEEVPPPAKTNRISAFFTKLVKWRSSDNVSSTFYEKRKSSLFKNRKKSKDVPKSTTEDFGVEETTTLTHFVKPKPPRNRRRPMKNGKVQPLAPTLEEDETLNDLEINREVPKIETPEEEIIDDNNDVVMRKSVMSELSRSLSSRSGKSLSENLSRVSSKPNVNRASDIFTQRLRSHNSNEGIENPTSL